MTSKIKEYYRYNLGKGVAAFSTGRDTDHPDDPYGGFNACHYTHGNPQEVAACRNMLYNALPGLRELVIPRQTHSLNVALIDSCPVGDLEDVDALVTALPGVAIAVNTADCVPVLMADPVAGVIAAVHSGWRGTVGHIAVKAVDVMEQAGAQRERISVAMGPSICTGCFEVGPEVADVFDNEYPDVRDIVFRTGGELPHIDLRNAIVHDLVEIGIHRVNIDSSAPCSRCNWTEWWSARRMGINSGRTLSLVMLQK